MEYLNLQINKAFMTCLVNKSGINRTYSVVLIVPVRTFLYIII